MARRPPKLHDRASIARFISENFFPISHSRLAALAVHGKGPPFYKISSNRVAYPEPNAAAWARARMGRLVRSAREARPAESVTLE